MLLIGRLADAIFAGFNTNFLRALAEPRQSLPRQIRHRPGERT
jgi:hypothetical protein